MLRDKDGGTDGTARLEVAVRLCRLGERVALADVDAHLVARHRAKQLARSGVELVAQQHGQARSGAGPAGREWSQSASSVRSAVSRLSGWSSIR